MKKTLNALAGLAASTASMAQVTLYGVADVSLAGSSDPGVGLSNKDFQLTSSNVLNNGNSRFGLRGTEDLGGGLMAMFNFEGGIVLGTGAGNTSGGNLFSRASWVALEGGFGRLTFGRTLTTSFFSVASWELTGTANYSVVANQFGFGGQAGPRDSNVIKYDMKAGGFNASASFIPEANVGYGTAAAPKSKYDLAVGYAAGPLSASLGYNKVADGAEGTVLGGAYDFGGFKVAASYHNGKTGAGATTADGFSIGASVPMGPWTFTADVANDTKFKDTDWLLEAKYALSKRTFVYGAFMRDGKSDGRTKASNPLNKEVDGYAMGLRHNF
jgi:predicted porin